MDMGNFAGNIPLQKLPQFFRFPWLLVFTFNIISTLTLQNLRLIFVSFCTNIFLAYMLELTGNICRYSSTHAYLQEDYLWDLCMLLMSIPEFGSWDLRFQIRSQVQYFFLYLLELQKALSSQGSATVLGEMAAVGWGDIIGKKTVQY